MDHDGGDFGFGEEFRAARQAVLEGFLARPAIFASAAGANRFEARARANLAVELAGLRGPLAPLPCTVQSSSAPHVARTDAVAGQSSREDERAPTYTRQTRSHRVRVVPPASQTVCAGAEDDTCVADLSLTCR